jgi:hypothetical protein
MLSAVLADWAVKNNAQPMASMTAAKLPDLDERDRIQASESTAPILQR